MPCSVLNYFQVPVHNVQLMEILDSFQDLQDDTTGILFRVAASFQNSVQQLTSSHSETRTHHGCLSQLTQDAGLCEMNMQLL